MILKIELQSRRYCDGCPCLVGDMGKKQCMLNWYMIQNELHKGYIKYIRPDWCIEKNEE